MILRKIDIETGLFIEDVLLESIPIDVEGILDPQYIAESAPEGFYWPKWTGKAWVEGGQAPEPKSMEPTETEVLQAQVKAANDYMDFLEEVIIEMAQVVYK